MARMQPVPDKPSPVCALMARSASARMYILAIGSAEQFARAGGRVRPPIGHSVDIEDPDFLDMRTDLVFDLVSHLRVQERRAERRVNADLPSTGVVLTFDKSERKFLAAIAQVLDPHLRTEFHRGFARGDHGSLRGNREEITLPRRIDGQAGLVRANRFSCVRPTG